MITELLEAPVSRLVTLPSGEPDLTLGWEAIGWAQKWLVQPNGPNAGKPWRATPSQVRFALWWWAVDEDGRWLFHHAARRMAKGTGKSPFAAVCSLVEFCAPIRLKDFDHRRPGGCLGKPVDMPLVLISATAESQTSNTMRMVRAFAPKKSRVAEAHNLDPGKTQFYRQPEGELKVTTSSYTAAEGSEPTFQVADETEHWKPSNGGVDLASTLIDNLTKSGSRLLETSNAWIPGQESVAESTFDAWVAQEEGRYRAETKILYDARIAPPDTDPADPVSLEKALEFVKGDCWWQDTAAIKQRFWSKNSRPDDVRRKYLNWPTVAWDAWVDLAEWNRLAQPDQGVPTGERIVLFFDGSKSRDASALVGCRVSDGHVFVLGIWEPNPNDPEAVVDVSDVDRVVRETFEDFQVAAFFSDVREWESWALAEWPNRYQDDLEMWAVPSGRPPQAIAWDMRSHKVEFARAVEACHADILEQSFTHDGDSRLARHVSNARRRPYQDMISIGKESADSPRKIDAAVAMVGARMVRRLLPAPKKKTGSLW